jgi:hypothetical protein
MDGRMGLIGRAGGGRRGQCRPGGMLPWKRAERACAWPEGTRSEVVRADRCRPEQCTWPRGKPNGMGWRRARTARRRAVRAEGS